jgi:16S rRNA (guanine1207-N2)-methyltransferase
VTTTESYDSGRMLIHPVINGVQLHLRTHAKLFSPHRADAGTVSMLTVTELRPQEHVLDLGCGYGLVGIYMGKLFGGRQVVMSDSDPLAVEVARANTVLNDLSDIPVVLSDGFERISRTDFTLIMSNPPYHADFAVPKAFIEGAWRHLIVGGRLVMVVRRVTWYKNKMQAVFGGVRITHADGYAVLESQKRSEGRRTKPAKTTTRKHLRRLRASAANKRR